MSPTHKRHSLIIMVCYVKPTGENCSDPRVLSISLLWEAAAFALAASP